MDLLPLIATTVGAAIALSGTLLADVRRDRRQRDRDNQQLRREVYVGFALALNTAHDTLRQVGNGPATGDERRAAAGRALGEVYGARERLLMIATEPVAAAGEAAFLRLGDIRNAVRDGATTKSDSYRATYERWAEAIWHFRMTVRSELGQQSLPQLMEGERAT